ncbi:MAG: hypothetical protein QXF56_02210 [Candidatus Micrarchaeia archaeon]
MSIESMCEQSLDLEVKDRCFSALAFQHSNSLLCNRIQNSTARDYCVMRIALLELNESECSNIHSELEGQCRNVVIGVRQNNSLVCMWIKDNETAEICRLRVS